MFRHVITKRGLSLLAKQQTGEALPNVTRVLIGSGCVDEELLEEQLAVSEPIAEMEVGEKVLLEGKVVRLPLQFSNANLAETELIRQIGVYSEDPDEGEILYQLVQYELPVPMPSYLANHGGVVLFSPEIDLLFANGAISAITPTPGWLVSREDLEKIYVQLDERFEEHIVSPEAHPDIRKNIGDSIDSAMVIIEGKISDAVSKATAPGTATPLMDGTAKVGTSSKAAREDHVHPTDTSRAAASHNHAATEITSGTLAIARGGTGATTASAALTALGGAASSHTHTPASIGAAATSHNHTATEISSGTLPIARGGTGATTASTALAGLGAAASGHTHSNASTSAAGFLSASDKQKIDNCPANVNTALAGKAGTATPNVIELPISSSYQASDGIFYFKTQDNVVTVYGSVDAKSGAIVNYDVIGTMPTGYRIGKSYETPVIFHAAGGGGFKPGIMRVNSDGRLVLRIDLPTREYRVYFNITYVAQL